MDKKIANTINAPIETDSVFQKALVEEKLKIAFKNLLLSVPANLICASLVFIGLYQTDHFYAFLNWYIAVIIVTLFRFFSIYYYNLQPKKYFLQLSLFTVGVIISASLWGYCGAVLLPMGSLLQQTIIIVIMAGISAGGVQTLQTNLLASCLSVILNILPLCIWLFLQPGFEYLILGIGVTTYLLSMLIIAFRGYKLFEQSARLRYENIELVENLKDTNTKLKNTYQVIEENAIKLQNIQENAPIGMAVLSLEGSWVQINQTLCKIVGYTKNELEHLRLRDIICPDDLANDLINNQKMISGTLTTSQSEMRFIHKDGQLIWVLVYKSLMHDNKDNPLYFIAQIEDITARKKDETMLIQLHEKTRSMLTELQQHEIDTKQISKMNDMLQICQDLNEAYKIISNKAEGLFPSFSGALVTYEKSNNSLKTIKQWGDQLLLKKYFSPEDCWALREGHFYIMNGSNKELVCYHFESLPVSGYICLPQLTQTGVIGLLVLIAPKGISITPYQQQLAVTFNDIIRLFLFNIRLRETLREQSIRDPLTQLYNRRYLNELLPRELSRIIREKRQLCVSVLDIDFFKHFNDKLGHSAGDEVLKFIGKLLKENFRGSDITCRYGGEEFVVVLVDLDLSGALPRLQKFREKVKSTHLPFHDQNLPQITVSIGVAEAPNNGTTMEAIIRAADEALYVAKQKGRDRIEIFNNSNKAITNTTNPS